MDSVVHLHGCQRNKKWVLLKHKVQDIMREATGQEDKEETVKYLVSFVRDFDWFLEVMRNH